MQDEGGDAVRSQRIFILWWNITVDVEPGAGGDTPHSIGRLAPVQPAITGEHRGDVQMTHHQPVTSQVLTNQHPANWSLVIFHWSAAAPFFCEDKS